jgi:hypothetical protein
MDLGAFFAASRKKTGYPYLSLARFHVLAVLPPPPPENMTTCPSGCTCPAIRIVLRFPARISPDARPVWRENGVLYGSLPVYPRLSGFRDKHRRENEGKNGFARPSPIRPDPCGEGGRVRPSRFPCVFPRRLPFHYPRPVPVPPQVPYPPLLPVVSLGCFIHFIIAGSSRHSSGLI